MSDETQQFSHWNVCSLMCLTFAAIQISQQVAWGCLPPLLIKLIYFLWIEQPKAHSWLASFTIAEQGLFLICDKFSL